MRVGSIFTADYSGNNTSIKTVVSDIDSMNAIQIENSTLYYNSINSTIYKYDLNSNQTKSTLVTDKAKDATTFAVLDKYLYIIDNVKGLLILKPKGDGSGEYEDEPLRVDVGPLELLKSITIFKSSAAFLFS